MVFALPGDAGFTRFRSGRTGGGRGRGLRGAAVLGLGNGAKRMSCRDKLQGTMWKYYVGIYEYIIYIYIQYI